MGRDYRQDFEVMDSRNPKMPFALTIDTEGDYWDQNTTKGIQQGVPQLLDLFQKLEIPATFFWTAKAAQKHRDVVSQVISQGHEIGCHGLNHENFSVLDYKKQSEIIDMASDTLRSFGTDCIGFRAPRLRVNESLFAVLVEHGFTYDSSIPFWGIRRYLYGNRYDSPGIVELKCTPSYAFRVTPRNFSNIISRSCLQLGYAVFFTHPWEIITPPSSVSLPLVRRMNFINTMRTGPLFFHRLEEYLFQAKEVFSFVCCRDLALKIMHQNGR